VVPNVQRRQLPDIREEAEIAAQIALETSASPWPELQSSAMGARPRPEGGVMNTNAVVTVGAGRGFIVSGEWDRFIITAAHCLPEFPTCSSFSTPEERTYESLIGPLGRDKTVWAECLFADPVGDIAVLGAVDGQEMSHEWEGYQQMVEEREPLSISEVPPEGSVSLLSLDQRWFECQVKRSPRGSLWLFDASENIVGGMSGSPILAGDGSAIGVVCTGSSDDEG
jgi:hypothetical protein